MKTLPPFPAAASTLPLEGFSIGHGTDRKGGTGTTVILCPEGALAAAEVRGSATGTRQFDSLVAAHHIASRAHGVVLAGGSGFGLDASGAVVSELARGGHGFETGYGSVPLVPTAILFDLSFGDSAAIPGEELAREAMTEARLRGSGAAIPMGSVGAGTGATVGKVLGPDQGMKGGVGFASFSADSGLTVAAVVAVNAFGDVVDPREVRILAGCRRGPETLELAEGERVLASLPSDFATGWEGNTTLAVVLTNADIGKVGLLKVCHMAFGGLYRTLRPALSIFDGDLVLALTEGGVPAHLNQVGVLAQAAVAEAILRGVEAADGFGILPAARDLPGFTPRFAPA